VEQPDSAHEVAGLPLFHGPEAVPAQLPMPDDRRHLSPRLPAFERLALAQETHHLRVGADPRVLLEVFLAEHPQDQARGFQNWHGSSFPRFRAPVEWPRLRPPLRWTGRDRGAPPWPYLPPRRSSPSPWPGRRTRRPPLRPASPSPLG